jgi:pimeloyl-ACP methyl ester carboxylesterase
MAPDDRNEPREGYAEIGDVRLHYVEAGEGPLIVLLHGFPEFWFGWRLQIKPLARRDFASSHPTCAATTCHRSRPASRPTPPTSWPPTSAV